MVTGHIVPFDAVGVKVVEDTQASLGFGFVAGFVAVIGLGLALVSRKLPSSPVGPVTLSLDPSLLLARWPGENLALVVQATSGPVVTLSELSSLSKEVISAVVAIQRDGTASEGLAVVVGLCGSELLAVGVIPSVHNLLSVEVVGRAQRRTTGALAVVGVLEGKTATGLSGSRLGTETLRPGVRGEGVGVKRPAVGGTVKVVVCVARRPLLLALLLGLEPILLWPLLLRGSELVLVSLPLRPALEEAAEGVEKSSLCGCHGG